MFNYWYRKWNSLHQLWNWINFLAEKFAALTLATLLVCAARVHRHWVIARTLGHRHSMSVWVWNQLNAFVLLSSTSISSRIRFPHCITTGNRKQRGVENEFRLSLSGIACLSRSDTENIKKCHTAHTTKADYRFTDIFGLLFSNEIETQTRILWHIMES